MHCKSEHLIEVWVQPDLPHAGDGSFWGFLHRAVDENPYDAGFRPGKERGTLCIDTPSGRRLTFSPFSSEFESIDGGVVSYPALMLTGGEVEGLFEMPWLFSESDLPDCPFDPPGFALGSLECQGV